MVKRLAVQQEFVVGSYSEVTLRCHLLDLPALKLSNVAALDGDGGFVGVHLFALVHGVSGDRFSFNQNIVEDVNSTSSSDAKSHQDKAVDSNEAIMRLFKGRSLGCGRSQVSPSGGWR